jgi:LmbE family N-acetylglucosaminyl deacetylase
MDTPPILVVAPHCLDEVLGCGGTMARHAAAGGRIEVLVLFGDGTGHDAARREAAQQAAGVLGIARFHFGGLPEGRGDTVALVDVIGKIEREVRDLRPATVYVPHGGSLHIDHQITFRAAVTATRPLPSSPVRNIYATEILSSTEWGPAATSAPFRPNRFIDVAATLERKIKALECYRGEMRDPPHSRSIDSVRAQARLRGTSVGLEAAEAFEVVREIDTA